MNERSVGKWGLQDYQRGERFEEGAMPLSRKMLLGRLK